MASNYTLFMDLLKDLDYDKSVLETALKVALLNAAKHNGKANPGSVIGGVLGSHPDVKKDMKNLSKLLQDLIKRVNDLPLEDQKKYLLEIDPSALDKKEKEVDLFKNLSFEEGQEVRTAFPPSPEKHPHIGHVKALMLNYLLAEEKKGDFYLRFEDTNPKLVKEEYYDIMTRYFEWMGVSWKEAVCASDYMSVYYKHCEELIKKGEAYACNSPSEDFKNYRMKGINPPAQSNSVEENLRVWNLMLEGEVENYVIRLKIDISHKNSTMREPAIMRVIKEEHARHGKKYLVWPTYDFQNSIMDGYFKITHRLRSKEFEMRNELQRYIQKLLGYKETQIYEFARFNLEGVESSGRKIRDGIEEGKYIGWDDPQLTTLAALKRRGFQPEAIKSFILSTGVSKSESTLTWDDLVVHNKRVLDVKAKRYFFVKSPVLVKIKNAPVKSVSMKLLYDSDSKRTLDLKDELYISKDDYESLEEGVYRFMEAYNVFFKNREFEFLDESISTYKKKGKGMLHYLPRKDYETITIMMPDKEEVKGFVESNNIQKDEVVQFERFGFCRKDSEKTFWYTH